MNLSHIKGHHHRLSAKLLFHALTFEKLFKNSEVSFFHSLLTIVELVVELFVELNPPPPVSVLDPKEG